MGEASWNASGWCSLTSIVIAKNSIFDVSQYIQISYI